MAITTGNSRAIINGARGKDEQKMHRVRITDGTLINGVHVAPGKVVEVDQALASVLFSGNKAVPVADEPEKPTTRVPKETLTRAPEKPKTIKKKGKGKGK